VSELNAIFLQKEGRTEVVLGLFWMAVPNIGFPYITQTAL